MLYFVKVNMLQMYYTWSSTTFLFASRHLYSSLFRVFFDCYRFFCFAWEENNKRESKQLIAPIQSECTTFVSAIVHWPLQ